MRRNLIPNEIARRNRVNVFTPSVLAEWQEEENERAFLEWCRTPEEREFRPDTTQPIKSNWVHRILGLVP